MPQGWFQSWRNWPFWLRLVAVIIGLPFLVVIGNGLVRLGERLVNNLERTVFRFAEKIANPRFYDAEDLIQLSTTLLIVILVFGFLLGPRGPKR